MDSEEYASNTEQIWMAIDILLAISLTCKVRKLNMDSEEQIWIYSNGYISLTCKVRTFDILAIGLSCKYGYAAIDISAIKFNLQSEESKATI